MTRSLFCRNKNITEGFKVNMHISIHTLVLKGLKNLSSLLVVFNCVNSKRSNFIWRRVRKLFCNQIYLMLSFYLEILFLHSISSPPFAMDTYKVNRKVNQSRRPLRRSQNYFIYSEGIRARFNHSFPFARFIVELVTCSEKDNAKIDLSEESITGQRDVIALDRP